MPDSTTSISTASTSSRAMVHSARAPRDRNAELVRLYAGMNSSMNEICAGYDDAELEVLADFLRRTVDAGREATEKLAGD